MVVMVVSGLAGRCSFIEVLFLRVIWQGLSFMESFDLQLKAG
jgi:hypothetical protein